MSELMFENRWEHFVTLFIDLILFFVHSIFNISETIFLSILPEKYRKLKNVSGQVVLITGGGGGVGSNLAKYFAKLNAKVVIWDINKEAIQKTIDLLSQDNLTCNGYVVDVSNRESIYEMAKAVKTEIGNVDILINNAGIVCCKTICNIPDKVIENTYAVNILSHYWTVKSFLPDMMENNQGHIVTIGSVTGLLGAYGCTDYSATKFACVGFHESLFSELKTHDYNINLTLVCPSYINSGMFHGVKPRLFPMLEPDYVAEKIINSIRKNEVNCILPNDIRVLTAFKSLLPSKVCWEAMERVIRGPQAMSMYKGRGRVSGG